MNSRESQEAKTKDAKPKSRSKLKPSAQDVKNRASAGTGKETGVTGRQRKTDAKTTTEEAASSIKSVDRSRVVVRKETAGLAKAAQDIGVFPRDPNSTVSAAEHALGENRSSYTSVSERRGGAPGFEGERVRISVSEAVRHGAEYVSHEQLTSDVREHAEMKPSDARRASAWETAQAGQHGEREALLRGYIEPSAVETGPTRALRGTARALGALGLVMSIRDLSLAAIESAAQGSLRPIAAESIRQAGAWTGSILGFSLGGYLLGTAAVSSFVALAVPLAVGLALGTAFYHAFDMGADTIYEN